MKYLNYLAICLACKNTWIATAPEETSPEILECPNCYCQDSFAAKLPMWAAKRLISKSKKKKAWLISSDDYLS